MEKYRGRFSNLGVRLGAPSFVWPAGFSENAAKLKPVFKEVQLTAYEPAVTSPISDEELSSLRSLNDPEFGYSLHLPIPTSMALPGGAPEKILSHTMLAYDKAQIRNYVLHVEKSSDAWNPALVPERISSLLEATGVSPERICVENIIGSPFAEAWESVRGLGVSVCFDVGHWLFEGGNPEEFFDKYGDRIRMAHLHGVAGGRDHLPLTNIPQATLKKIIASFAEMKMDGAVIIEIFSPGYMAESLEYLSKIYG
ncbi:MAG: sugar phosphate isomerase/epimerase [Nitrospinae bacterium]|nr:sugar phosphate isomerase/epimerase [Nitrospinota bacterium]